MPSPRPLAPDRQMVRRQLIAKGTAAFATSPARSGDRVAAARWTQAQFRSYYGDLHRFISGPLRARLVGRGDGPGFRYENVLFESHPGWEVNATVYLPATLISPRPAVVVPVGHSGKQFAAYQLPCQYFARAGFVAITFDPPGVAGEKQPGNDHFFDGVRCHLTGDTSSRYFLGDVLRAMDYLETRADVDSTHGFACTGVSGGGHSSVFAALLDDRITAVAPSCCLAPQASLVLERSYSSCPETLMPGRLRDGLDDSDLVCALAPRPVLLMAGREDEVYVAGESRHIAAQATAHYQAVGAAENFTYFEDEGGHDYSLRQARVFCTWLRRHWQLPDTDPLPDPTDATFTLLPAERLQCHPNPAGNMVTLTQRRAAQLAPAHVAPDQAGLRALAGMDPSSVAPEVVTESPGQKTWFHTWHEVQVLTEPGTLVPVSRAECPEARATLWHFNAAGRLQLAERGGLLMEVISHTHRARPKTNLLAADLRGWGETASAATPYEFISWGGPDRFLSYVSASLAEPVEAQRLRDAWQLSRLFPPSGRTVLHATGAAAPVALHFAALTRRFDAVVLQDAPASYADLLATADFNWPHDLVWPGVLSAYDLPLLAASIGCPVHWVNPRDGANAPLPADQTQRRANVTWHHDWGDDQVLELLLTLLHG
ncbi:MAG: alpha/beta hydrolase family protein [Cephaloticoccus sp.]